MMSVTLNEKKMYPPVVASPLFFLDYDGTLSDIVDEPMEAFPHKDALPLLRDLDKKYPLWVVTGRHLRDLSTLLRLKLKAVGLHGLQQGVLGNNIETKIPDEVKMAMQTMKKRVPDIKGVWIEDKEVSFAVHYRGAPNEETIEEMLTQWLDDLPECLSAIWGKKVVELKPANTSKGYAVRRLSDRFPDSTPVYIGDDTTDEAAFLALSELERETVSVKVGEGATRAKFRLPDVQGVIDYLKRYTS